MLVVSRDGSVLRAFGQTGVVVKILTIALMVRSEPPLAA